MHCLPQVLFYLFITVPHLKAGITNLKISTNKAISNISDKFLSVAIDTGQIRNNFGKLNFTSTKVENLAKALSPCYLRVGGTASDFLKFSPSSNNSQHYKQYDIFSSDPDPNEKPFVNFTMSAEQWDQLNIFVAKVGWSLIFDLNSLLRKNGNWSPENAQLLLNYTSMKGYKIAGWELGNEPDAYNHKFGYRITASQRAEDYLQLHSLLNQYSEWRKCVTIGPSTTQLKKKRVKQYLKEFLQTGGPDIVTNPSFHHYYVNGRETSIDQFMSPAILDELPPEITAAYKIVKHPPYGRVWLGETSSAYGGGAPGLSDRYVAGFMWLDKLGISAALGISVVVRQDFYGGHYSLIDSKTLDPNPDFWLSYMFNTLVGQSVFNVSVQDKSGYVRMYSHCANVKRSNYTPGSITVYGMNLKEESTTMLFPQFIQDIKLHVYMLQPADEDGLKSKYVSLNGRRLKLNTDFSLPDVLTPVVTTNNVTFPPQSFGFIVIPNSNTSICQTLN